MHESFEEFLSAELSEWQRRGLDRQFRVVDSAAGAVVSIGGRSLLNFASNDYLGLAADPLLREAARRGIEKYGVGAGASRLICGNSASYAELERRLACFKKKQAAIVFGSGYAANAGVLSALLGDGDTIILDKLCHASLIDGARLSGAQVRIYPHENLKRLEELLAAAARSSRVSPRPPRTLIVTDSVFSMDGDCAPLADIVAIKEKYGAWLMIDEAHATGVFGKNRRGLAEAAGVEDRVEITMGTLSKALGCQGGYIVGSQSPIDFLRNKARSLIYSTAMPPAIVAAGAAAVDFIMSEEGRKRCERLWQNVSEMKNGLLSLSIAIASNSPIFPIVIGNEQAAVELSRKLYEQGIFTPAIRYPTVPKGGARLRVTVTAAHTSEQIKVFLGALSSQYCHSERRAASPLPQIHK